MAGLAAAFNGLRTEPYVSFANGKPNQEVYKLGEYVDHNMIDRRGADGTFVIFDPVKFVYDLRLKPGEGAIGAGNSVEAPSVDITGTYRGARVDVGAYQHQPMNK